MPIMPVMTDKEKKRIKPRYLVVNDADGKLAEATAELAKKNGRTVPMEARRIFELGLSEYEKAQA